MSKKILFFLSTLFLFSNCGITDIAESTFQGTQEMNEKMTRMEEMTAAIEEYNANMDQGIHLQILSESLKGMLDPENTKILNPPYRMLPFAQTYAEEATELELIMTLHVLLQEVLFAPTQFNELRMISLVAAGSIAAFVPQELTEAILATHVDGKNVFEETAYTFLVMRDMFIRDVLVRPFIENSTFINVGIVREASHLFSNLKYISARPYLSKLKFKVASLGVDVSIDPSGLNPNVQGSLADSALRRFKGPTGLSAAELADPEVQALLAVFQ